MLGNRANLAIQKKWAIGMITACSFIMSNVATAADREYPKGAGFIPIGSAEGSVTVPNATMGTTLMSTVAGGFNLRPEAVNSTAFNCFGGATPTTIGGYSGLNFTLKGQHVSAENPIIQTNGICQ